MNGVNKAEPMLQVPTRLVSAKGEYATITLGLDPVSTLYGLYSTSGEQQQVSASGVSLSESLRKVLGVNTGDTIKIQ